MFLRRSGVVVVVSLLVSCSAAPTPDAGGTDAGHDAGTVDAGVDAGLDAGVDAGVDAGTDAGCAVRVLFDPVDFLPTMVGCATEANLTIRNDCPAQSVTVTTSAPFAVDGGAVALPAYGLTTVPVRFSPTTVGPRQAVATITGTSVSSPSLAVQLRGLGVATLDTTDQWPQATRPVVDLLVVVSDGPGMAPVQTSLEQNLGSFWQYATAANLDVRGASLLGRVDGGTVHLDPLHAPPVAFGASGQPTASCLERAVDELTRDAGWVRHGDVFALYCAQNTLEQPASGGRAAWLSALAQLGGADVTVVNALARFTPDCTADDAELRALVDATGGGFASVCGPDAGAPFSTTGAQRRHFALSQTLGGDGGLDVQVDGVSLPSGWHYDAARNEVVLDTAAMPGTSLSAHYTAACAP